MGVAVSGLATKAGAMNISPLNSSGRCIALFRAIAPP